MRCERCGRQQLDASEDSDRGITDEEAALLGWAKTETGWLCPFDSDKGPAGLRSVFEKVVP